MSEPRIAYAGDRDISVWVLEYLLNQGVRPLALLVSDSGRATHDSILVNMCPFLDETHILCGKAFREPPGLELLRGLDLDYVIGIHFPYIVPEAVLQIPRFGVLNLHPALLPYNRGWHTPSWAILDGTPIGATLHFMDAGVDTGDIVHQKCLEVSPGDTANSLYHHLKRLELETFQEAWPQIAAGSYRRQPQDGLVGTEHKRQELFQESVQRLDLDTPVSPGELLRRLRALTTNAIAEAAYYDCDGKRYRVQVQITEEEIPGE